MKSGNYEMKHETAAWLLHQYRSRWSELKS